MGRSIAIVGLVLVAAGFVLGVVSIHQQGAKTTSAAAELFDQIATGDDPAPVQQLARARLSVRRAYLERALESADAANQILGHQHELSVALSRVDSSDTRRLFNDVLRKRLLDAEPPAVVDACMVLMTDWDLIDQISPPEAAHITDRLAQRMELDAAKGARERYAAAIGALAPRLPTESAGALLARLVKLASSVEPANAYDAVQAAVLVAPRASSGRRAGLAVALAQKLSKETRNQPVVVLAPMLAPLAAGSGEREAGEILTRITEQIVNQWNATGVDALLPALGEVVSRAPPGDAEHNARMILSHVEFEVQPSVVLSLTQVLHRFGDRIPQEIYLTAANSLLGRIRAEKQPDALTIFTASLGALNHQATQAQFTEAAEIIVSRFATANDMTADASLAGAIDAVADELQPAVAARLSSKLIDRMLAEQRIGPLLYIAAGLISIADEVQLPMADRLSGRLLGRLRREQNSDALRTLSFSMAAFEKSRANWDEAAAVLDSRIAEEQDPDDVRKLASGLYALRNKANPKYFEQAASLIASGIETRIRDNEIAELTVSLSAMADKAGAAPFDRAAAAIVANANQIVALEPSLARIAPKVSAAKAQELAATLASRVDHESGPARLRALGSALALFSRTPADAATKLIGLTDAPCQLEAAKVAILNPLCSESSWSEAAMDLLHLKIVPMKQIEPDFAQLDADDDDDDDAPTGDANEAPPLDFQKLSDALTSLGARPPIPDPSPVPWTAIGLAAGGATLLLATAFRSR